MQGAGGPGDVPLGVPPGSSGGLHLGEGAQVILGESLVLVEGGPHLRGVGGSLWGPQIAWGGSLIF